MTSSRPRSAGISRVAVLGVVLGLAVVGFFVRGLIANEYDHCETCWGTGGKTCGAPGCDRGRVMCTATCLKRESPGWEPRDIPGHAPGLLWMRFDNADRTTIYVSQNHSGQAMENQNGHWVLTGTCKVCAGSGRMPCPACQGKIPCKGCGGKGKIRKWF